MPGGRFRVVTLNCLYHGRHRARLRVIGRLLRALEADVCCLQEIFYRGNVRLLEHGPAVYRGWGPLVRGGLVTLPREPATGSAYETYRTGLWFEWGARKGFLSTRLRAGSQPVTVMNTHLLANYDQDWALDNRYARPQLDELEQLSAAVGRVSADELLVVAGDFNVPTAAPQFQRFLASTGLRAALDWSVDAPGSRGSLGIDNVLYRGPRGRGVQAEARTCFEEPATLGGGVSVYPSDHVGVVAELRW